MSIPNKAFDLEYSTQIRKQYEFLRDHGFKPSFVKKNKQYNFLTYKYTKTSSLFKALQLFYRYREYEKEYDRIQKLYSQSQKFSDADIDNHVQQVMQYE